jgi:hypothetical protein
MRGWPSLGNVGAPCSSPRVWCPSLNYLRKTWGKNYERE